MNSKINQQIWLKRGLQTFGIIGLVIIIFAIFQSFKSEAATIEEQNVNVDEVNEVVMQQIAAPLMPTNPNFCGELIDLTDVELYERFDRELVVNSFLHGSTILILKRANRYFPLIEKILKEEGVPDDMKYLCVAESGLDQVVSSAGAAGFWQFMKSTAPEYDLFIDNEIDERYNIEKSTYAACKYLKESKLKFGSWSLTAAAYNAGNKGVMNQVNLQGQNSYYDLFLNSETSRYVFRILALKYIMENPSQFGFNISHDQVYEQLRVKKISVDASNVNWIDFASQNGISYKTLRYYNPQIRKSEWVNRNRRSIEVLLPL